MCGKCCGSHINRSYNFTRFYALFYARSTQTIIRSHGSVTCNHKDIVCHRPTPCNDPSRHDLISP